MERECVQVIPRGYVVLHVVMADMKEGGRMFRLRYFVGPGRLHDAISASAISSASCPSVYNADFGLEEDHEAIVYGGVAWHYANYAKARTVLAHV